jgi:hypothetical protein
MRLYVANCTHQRQTVTYRLLESKGGHALQTVEVGAQMRLSPDLNRPQIDYIVEHLLNFGARWADDAEAIRSEHVVPLLLKVDGFVKHDQMMKQIEANDRILRTQGALRRKEAAIATSHGMREMTPNAASNVALSVEEEKPGSMDHGGDKPLAEGYRMTDQEP